MKKLLLLSAAGALLAGSFSGCSSVSHNGARHVNVLGGVATVQQGKFAQHHPVSFSVKRSDWSSERNISGTETSLLWGLFTYSDY